jgi:DNA primase
MTRLLTAEELAAVVGKTVRLDERGWSKCPFHAGGNERTPSFHVFKARDGRGRYYCQSCKIGGDSISWMRQVERKSFREAGGDRPDPEEMARVSLEREQSQLVEAEWNDLLARQPDLPSEVRHFIEPDLAGRLRRLLR